MNGQYLTIRLTESEAELIARLGAATGLTKTEIVKRALRLWIEDAQGTSGGLFDLGALRFGRHGDDSRQAADNKAVVRGRLDAKRSG